MVRFNLILILTLISCKVSQNITQGIEGRIIRMEGDRMPGITRTAPAGKPVRCTVYIYSLTSQRDAVHHDGVFYDSIKTKMIKKVKSDDSGRFSVKLVSGKYSVFIKEANGMFANTIDGAGNINPVTVSDDRVTEMNIRIDYKATY